MTLLTDRHKSNCDVTIWNTRGWLVQRASGDVQKWIMLPGFVSAASCYRGTWREPRRTMYLRRFVDPTTILGRSIRILCCCIMDKDTNLLHLLRDISKQILTVSLDQHWTIMPRSCAIRSSGNIAQLRGQYLYNVSKLVKPTQPRRALNTGLYLSGSSWSSKWLTFLNETQKVL